VRRACQFGLAARGVVFLLIGAFFAMAAYYQNPSQAKGFAGALDYVRSQPYGPWLLLVVALGVAAYGFYQFVLARYRHIDVGD
jgi:hypothetical protein